MASPDYPTHEEKCPCSGCYASNGDARAAKKERARIVQYLRDKAAKGNAEAAGIDRSVSGHYYAAARQINDLATEIEKLP